MSVTPWGMPAARFSDHIRSRFLPALSALMLGAGCSEGNPETHANSVEIEEAVEAATAGADEANAARNAAGLDR